MKYKASINSFLLAKYPIIILMFFNLIFSNIIAFGSSNTARKYPLITRGQLNNNSIIDQDTPIGAPPIRRVISTPAVLSTGQGLDGNNPFLTGSILQNTIANSNITADILRINIQAFDTNNLLANLIITQDSSIGSCGDTSGLSGGGVNVTINNGRTVTFTGSAGGNIKSSIYNYLNSINTDGNPATLVFNIPGSSSYFGNQDTLVNTDNLILNIKKGMMIVNNDSFGNIKNINIADHQSLRFENEIPSNILNLQNSTNPINFSGPSAYLVLYPGPIVDNVVVNNNSLAGDVDLQGNVALQPENLMVNFTTQNIDANLPIIGNSNTQRAGFFAIGSSYTGESSINIIGGVYSQNIELWYGEINFLGQVDVGQEGASTFTSAQVTANVNQNSNFGNTDFVNYQSIINVNNNINSNQNLTLTGNFIGDSSDTSNIAGRIIFSQPGILASSNPDPNVLVTNNLEAIENNSNGLVDLTGLHQTQLRFTNTNSAFNLADGFILAGGVNTSAPTDRSLTMGTLNCSENTITGNIGTHTMVSNINIEGGKTLTLAGTNINTNSLNFDQARGGILKLINNTNTLLSTNTTNTGDNSIIDAKSISPGNNLEISGNIGSDPTSRAIQNILSELSLNGANLTLNNGSVNINTVNFGAGSTGTLTLAGSNYQFGSVQNSNNITLVSAGGALYNTNMKVLATDFTNNSILSLSSSNISAAKLVSTPTGSGTILFIPGIGDSSFAVPMNQSNMLSMIQSVGGSTGHILGATYALKMELDNMSTITLNSNGNFAYGISGIPLNELNSTANNSTIKFVNNKPIILTFGYQSHGYSRAFIPFPSPIGTLELTNSDVTLIGPSSKFPFQNIYFSSLANTPTLTLDPSMVLDEINVNSNFVTNNLVTAPMVKVSGANNIAPYNNIGSDSDNIVNIQLYNNAMINVNSPKFFAGITTTTPSQGTVNLNVNDGNVYGLGASNANLNTVSINSNTSNYGNLYADNLNLDINVLTLNNAIWGGNGSIATTLNIGKTIGYINIITPSMVKGMPFIHVVVDDQAPLPLIKEDYILVDTNGGNLPINFDLSSIFVKSSNPYIKWSIGSPGDQNIHLYRVNNSEEVAASDITSAMNNAMCSDSELKNLQLLTTMTNQNILFDSISNFTDPKERGTLLLNLMTQVDNKVQKILGNITDYVGNLISYRLYNNTNSIPTAISSGEEYNDNKKFVVWISPFYNRSIGNKANLCSFCYNAKSTGAILGVDTLINDELTTIGGAISKDVTDVTYKDYKSGNKTIITDLIFSIYGAHKLNERWFMQTMIMYSVARIKTKEPRFELGDLKTVLSNYKYRSWVGELLFGYNTKLTSSLFFTPVMGVRYKKYQDSSYAETGTIYLNKTVSSKTNHKMEGFIGARIFTNIDMGGINIIPEVHAMIYQDLDKRGEKINAKFAGMIEPFIHKSDIIARVYNTGVSLSTKKGLMGLEASYDIYLAKKYINHQATLKLKVNL